MSLYIYEKLIAFGMQQVAAEYLSEGILLAFVIILTLLVNIIIKKLVFKLIAHYVLNNKFKFDNIMLERKVFHWLSHILPALVIYFFAEAFSAYRIIIQRIAFTYIFLVGMLAADAFLNAVDDIYRTYKVSRLRPIKSYLQVVKIFIYIIGSIIIIANIMGESPVYFLSGIGALTAVLMLIFRDSILGLVAGIQLASNDMVRIGDWIEMPKYGADGDVIDISLNTVKVENFDRTITTIPTYALISDSFKNWRGMQNSGGRRIKRSIYIDTSSIEFCSEQMLERFKRIHYLSDYIEKKQQEIDEHNLKHGINASEVVNGRRMTNIGTFRAYVQSYIENHPRIHKGMTRMVRQLDPCEHGLPLEVYAFTNETSWIHYEKIQADIFDHILAVAPQFGLRVFQEPSGFDMRTGLGYSLQRQD